MSLVNLARKIGEYYDLENYSAFLPSLTYLVNFYFTVTRLRVLECMP